MNDDSDISWAKQSFMMPVGYMPNEKCLLMLMSTEYAKSNYLLGTNKKKFEFISRIRQQCNLEYVAQKWVTAFQTVDELNLQLTKPSTQAALVVPASHEAKNIAEQLYSLNFSCSPKILMSDQRQHDFGRTKHR